MTEYRPRLLQPDCFGLLQLSAQFPMLTCCLFCSNPSLALIHFVDLARFHRPSSPFPIVSDLAQAKTLAAADWRQHRTLAASVRRLAPRFSQGPFSAGWSPLEPLQGAST